MLSLKLTLRNWLEPTRHRPLPTSPFLVYARPSPSTALLESLGPFPTLYVYVTCY
eukprot:m.154947 g.154947  ORF g.154947 m.154947 type:complete len:55 (-) comp16401_c0_seq1:2628-2792(-)